jgi:hypothetical protein
MRTQPNRKLALVTKPPKLTRYCGLSVDIYAPAPYDKELMDKAIAELLEQTAILTEKLLPEQATATVTIRQVWGD